jgi:threonine synthase
VATNRNDILHRFFQTGEYRAGSVQPSLAPSMDIQVSSNFERFLYYALGEDSVKLSTVMQRVKTDGGYTLSEFDRDTFSSSRATDADIRANIARIYERYGYVIDPHTACAFQDLNPDRVNVVLSTAHPAKFPEALREAIGLEPTHPSLEDLKTRTVVKHHLPADAAAIKDYIVRHAV